MLRLGTPVGFERPNSFVEVASPISIIRDERAPPVDGEIEAVWKNYDSKIRERQNAETEANSCKQVGIVPARDQGPGLHDPGWWPYEQPQVRR